MNQLLTHPQNKLDHARRGHLHTSLIKRPQITQQDKMPVVSSKISEQQPVSQPSLNIITQKSFSKLNQKQNIVNVQDKNLFKPTTSRQQQNIAQFRVNQLFPIARRLKTPAQIVQNTEYKYYLGTGNNHEIITRILSKRDYWKEVTDNSQNVNFKWQQGQTGYKYDKIGGDPNFKQALNHFECHQQISDKQYLVKNLTQYCESQKLNVFDYTPITFVIDFQDDQCESNLKNFFKFYEENMPPHIKEKQPDINKYFNKIKKRVKSSTGNQLQALKRNSQFTKLKMSECFKIYGDDSNYLWLLKPTFLNRGRGIHVFNTLDTLTKLIQEYQDGYIERDLKDKEDWTQNKRTSNPIFQSYQQQNSQQSIIKASSFVIQKYIEKPCLINDRKFDIRVWVLVTHEMDIHIFKEGYIRTSCEVYTPDNIDNPFIHLTNNAIQKHSENYGQFESGNQLSWKQFEKYVRRTQNCNFDFRKTIYSKMKELIVLSLMSVKKKIDPDNRKYCFEIFGYDFILDDDFNVYLIEVNTNPCIEESSPLLAMLIPRMLDDGFKLTLDQIFPHPKQSEQKKTLYPVEGYTDEETMWEFLSSLNDQRAKRLVRK